METTLKLLLKETDFFKILDILIKSSKDEEYEWPNWFLALWSDNYYTENGFVMIRDYIEKNHKEATLFLLKPETWKRKCVEKNWVDKFILDK